GEEERPGWGAAETAEDDVPHRTGRRRGGREPAGRDGGRSRDLGEQRLLASPAIGDGGQLAAEATEGVPGDAPGLVGDRAGFGDVVAAPRCEVGALEASAEELPIAGAGGDRGPGLSRVDVHGRVGRGHVLLLASTRRLQRDAARRGRAGGGVEENNGAVVAVLDAEPLVGVR